jgi:hypothetical protein
MMNKVNKERVKEVATLANACAGKSFPELCGGHAEHVITRLWAANETGP